MKIIPVRYQWLGIWVGVQLICGRKHCVMIDSGIEDAIKSAVIPEFEKHNLKLSSLSLVVNTHSHGDHTACNRELRDCTKTRFAIHSAGAEDLTRQQFPPDILLEDGMKINEDDMELEIIHTPGHSPDSCCILETSTGTLFTGDSIQGFGISELALPLWCDIETYRKSIQKLQKLYSDGKFSALFAGHCFQPSNGVLNGDEIPLFLQSSLDATDLYSSLANELKACDEKTFYNELIHRLNLKPIPEWEDLAFKMSRFLLQQAQSSNNN